MADPWFDPNLFPGIYGGLMGGLGGTLIGVAGGLGGDLARKGQRRLWVRIVLFAVLAGGLTSLAAGIAALALGQPGIIWEVLGGIGLLLSVGAFATLRGVERLCERAVNVQTPVGQSGESSGISR